LATVDVEVDFFVPDFLWHGLFFEEWAVKNRLNIAILWVASLQTGGNQSKIVSFPHAAIEKLNRSGIPV
jgi:hypothetical protein